MLPGGRRRGVSRGSVSLARCAVGHLPAIAATHPVQTVPVAASPAPPGTPEGGRCGDPPTPAADSTETPYPSGTWPRVMPPRRCPGLVLIQPDVALFGFEFGFYKPPEPSRVGQSLQRGVQGSVGQIVAGLATVQVLAVDCPSHSTRLPVPGFPDPLGAEPGGSRSLGPSATVISRHDSSGSAKVRSAMVRRCPPRSLGWRGCPNP